MTIEELISLLEAAEGPDRWLDAKLDAALRIGPEKMQRGYEWAWENFPTWAHHKQARGMCGVQHDNGDLGLIWDSPEFTASVDAAIALAEKVLPGCDICTQDVHPDFRQEGEPRHMAEIMTGLRWVTYDGHPEPNYEVSGSGKSNSRAISIVLATLRALQAKTGDRT